MTSTAIIAPPDYRLSPMRNKDDISPGSQAGETNRKRFVRVLEPITKIRERLTSCKRVDCDVDNYENYI